MLTTNCASIAIHALSGFRDNRAIVARFGDSAAATSYTDNALHGNVLAEKEVDHIEMTAWNRITVTVILLQTEASEGFIREVGLFSKTDGDMFARFVLPTPIYKGGAILTLTIPFGYDL
jgi:hypothetical protein